MAAQIDTAHGTSALTANLDFVRAVSEVLSEWMTSTESTWDGFVERYQGLIRRYGEPLAKLALSRAAERSWFRLSRDARVFAMTHLEIDVSKRRLI
jgi:hypothetical protein